jgi:hypothetical protein
MSRHGDGRSTYLRAEARSVAVSKLPETAPSSASRPTTASPSSMCHSPQVRHSKVYRSGSPPNRGVLRTSCIGRAQPTQRGGRGGLGADLSAHLSHMIHVQLAKRLSAKSEAAPYMRRQHYRDVAGDLIFGNRRSGASAPVVGFSRRWSRPCSSRL